MWVRLLIGTAFVWFAFVILRRFFRSGHFRGGTFSGGFGGRPKFQCATCKSCGKLFHDGVLCRFQGRETFKNETHIRNCIDHERR